MPPWYIDRNIGISEFKDDPSLSDAEIATISKWVDGGAVLGNAADMPAPRQFNDVDQWHIGKPDYIVQAPDGCPVPVELKLNVLDATVPFSNHVVQVGAYCLILEDYFDHAPTHGILRYADREFTIDYTPTLRKKVIKLLSEMERCSEQQPPPLARQRVAKCRACAFQPTCPVGRNK